VDADGNYPRQPPERRRLVRTQIEELFALYRLYPLPEFESVRQILGSGRPTVTRSRINHPLFAEALVGDEDA
jgi:hypothetical protein